MKYRRYTPSLKRLEYRAAKLSRRRHNALRKFEWQYDFVKKYLGDLAKVTVISFDAVDKEMSEYYSRYLIK